MEENNMSKTFQKPNRMNEAFDIAFQQTQAEQPPLELEVSGNIPKWINGAFYRNGPGLFATSRQSFNHWFDGLAIIHQFDIRNGKVEYQSKYIESNVKDWVLNQDTISFPEFATDPCGSIFKKLKSWFEGTNPKVSLTQVNDRFMALGETIMQLEIDKKTLQTVGVHDYSPSKYTPSVTTAHPHIEHEVLYNVVLKMGMLNYYDIIAYNVEKKSTTSICKIPIAKPSYMHSMGMSENYFILSHSPFECNSIDFILKKKPFIENFKWNSKKKSIIWVVSKQTGKVVHKLKTSPFFAFHFVNAFEKGDKLIFDMCSYPDAEVIQSFYLNQLADTQSELAAAKAVRFTLDLTTKLLNKTVVVPTALELPVIDERFLRKEHKHIYGVGIADQGNHQFYDQLVKINMETGEHTIWKDPDYYPGEPKFIPHNNAQTDDDGIILSILVNIKDKSKGSKLVFLDAKTFTEIAACYTSHTIIPGFHGCFLNN